MADFLLTRRSFLTAGMTAMLAPAVAQGAAADAAWPVFGNPQGRVTITEFFEYQCPNCKRLHPQLEAFVKEHGSIRLVMKDWPIFGDISVYASRMALAAGYTGSYQRALHGLMDLKGRLTMKRVDDSLKAAGMDTDRVRDALELNFNSIQAVLDSHAAEAKSLGLAGTPAFIVGTRLYPRVTDIDAIRAAVDKG